MKMRDNGSNGQEMAPEIDTTPPFSSEVQKMKALTPLARAAWRQRLKVCVEIVRAVSAGVRAKLTGVGGEKS